MKSQLLLLLGSLAASLTTSAAPEVKWFTIDGGGGASSGGTFTLRGTIGQSDATSAPLTGGTYTLRGGFWQDFAIPTPDGGPQLIITRLATGEVRIAWPAGAAGYGLQVSGNLINWAGDGPPQLTGAGEKVAPAPSPSSPRRFWRLQKP